MAIASYTTTHGQSAILQRVTGLIDTLRARAARRKVYNTTYRELMSLSDRDLTDLGLARSDIRRVAYQAAYGD